MSEMAEFLRFQPEKVVEEREEPKKEEKKVAAVSSPAAVPTYGEAGLGFSFSVKVDAYVAVKKEIVVLEDNRKELGDEIFAALGASAFKKVLVGERTVQIVDTDRTTLDKNKLVLRLVELGMKADEVKKLIDESSVTTHSAHLRIDMPKGRKDDRKAD